MIISELQRKLAAWTAIDKRDALIVCGALSVTRTEFGRTAKENGTGGTDHGTGRHYVLTSPTSAPWVMLESRN